MASSPRPMPNETARLRKAVSDPPWNLKLTAHAREEMAADNILAAAASHVLKHGQVVWMEVGKRGETWHVEGRDVDGRSIRLVVAVDEAGSAVTVVTAMVLKGRGQ